MRAHGVQRGLVAAPERQAPQTACAGDRPTVARSRRAPGERLRPGARSLPCALPSRATETSPRAEGDRAAQRCGRNQVARAARVFRDKDAERHTREAVLMHQHRAFEGRAAVCAAAEQQQVRQLAAGVRLREEVVDRIRGAGLAARRGKVLQTLPCLENRGASGEDQRRTLRPRCRFRCGCRRRSLFPCGLSPWLAPSLACKMPGVEPTPKAPQRRVRGCVRQHFHSARQPVYTGRWRPGRRTSFAWDAEASSEHRLCSLLWIPEPVPGRPLPVSTSPSAGRRIPLPLCSPC